MAERFLQAYGLADMLDDPRFATNEARVRHAALVDEAIAGAIGTRTVEENEAIIAAHALTAVRVDTIAGIEQDPHWQSRGLTTDVVTAGGSVRMHRVVPTLSATPGQIAWAGGDLGQDNADIYGRELGLSAAELTRLHGAGVI